MELRDILKALRRWWWLAALPVLVVGAYLALTYQPPPLNYHISIRFTAGSEPAETLSPDYDRYYAWLTSEYIANSLADLALTGAFARDVAARLAEDGIAVTAGALRGAIASDNAQSVLVIELVWPDPAEAIAVANAVTAELVEDGPSYYPQMADLGIVAHRVDVPQPVPLAPSLRARLLGPALRLGLAAAVGAGLVLVAYYVDPWVYAANDLQTLGLPVLATVPRHRWRLRRRRRTELL